MSLTQCQTCKAVIASSARACPQCGSRRGLSRTLVWAFLIVIAIGFSAISLRGVPPEPREGGAQQVVPEAASVPSKQDAVVAGELLQIAPDYAPDVARMLNHLMANYPACQQEIQPVTAVAVKAPRNPANPDFTVVCGKPKKVLVHFSWMDAVNKQIPAQPAAPDVVSRSQAANACEAAAKEALSRPSTVNFSRAWSAAFQDRPDGTAVFQTTFTADNDLGFESKFEITCLFTGHKMTSATFRPAG